MDNNNTINDLINRNNELRKQLTKKNLPYYENVLIYIRTAGLFYDGLEIEMVLMQILQDILAAQVAGETAEEYLGKKPQNAANEIIENLGKGCYKESLKLFGFVFGISSFFSLISQISTANNQINLLTLLVNGLLSFVIVVTLFHFIHKSIYTKSFSQNKIRKYGLLWILSVIILCLYTFLPITFPNILTITMTNSVMIMLNSFIIFTSLLYTFFRKSEKLLLKASLPFIIISNLLGILSRVEATHFFMAQQNGKLFAALATMAGFIWFSFYSFKESKKE